jgi:hypothetical protein
VPEGLCCKARLDVAANPLAGDEVVHLALTDVGVALRTKVEDLTDALGLQPWRAITDDDAATLERVAGALSGLASLFPAGALGPRYGQHR